MTNQEAIDILRNTAWSVTHEDLLRTVEAVGLAISALQAQESVDKELKCLRTEIFFLKAEKEAEKVDIFPELTAEEKKENRAYAQGYTDACKEIKAKSDLIKRQAACELCTEYFDSDDCSGGDVAMDIQSELLGLPSAQPEPLSDAYTKAVWTWLLDYQIKAAELKGRYTPYEVLSWVANDWRKEHE